MLNRGKWRRLLIYSLILLYVPTLLYSIKSKEPAERRYGAERVSHKDLPFCVDRITALPKSSFSTKHNKYLDITRREPKRRGNGEWRFVNPYIVLTS